MSAALLGDGDGIDSHTLRVFRTTQREVVVLELSDADAVITRR